VGENTNVNNRGEQILAFPAETGSFIYFSEEAGLRNQVQKRAMEDSRLGIPVLFGYDVIHGFRTVYPISLGQACSWNPGLVRQACAVAAQEARMSGVDWTFSPMIDVARDGRWGRVAEGYGEDPYTNAVYAVASVQGYQGDDLSGKNQVAACLKHYAGYGMSEGGRDYSGTDISRQTLWETYLPPYEAAVKAGAATLMSAFNDISGIPASANYYTLTEILKNRWKHDGFVVSDWNAVEQLIPQGLAADRKDAARKAFAAGVEMDMKDNCYGEYLVELVNEGKISLEQIDDAVSRVLRIKFRLGLFEAPYTPEYKESERFLLPESKRIAEQLAEESMVLLKNENRILPLVHPKKIAVIGPMAHDKTHLLGAWAAHGRPEEVVSIYEGLAQEFQGKSALSYAPGCDFEGNDISGFPEALKIAQTADVVLLCLGEKRAWSGENASRSTLALPNIQEQLVMEMKKAGKPLVVVLSNGRPLDLHTIEPLSDAIVEIWQPGIAGANPLAGILSGRINPSGKLAITFPYSTGQIPIYYNARQSSRPDQGKYQDIPSEPLYAFAHGLSYTDFDYGNPVVSAFKIRSGEKLTVEIPVTNTGERAGAETVHWYISDPVCSITRPVKELKFFEKRHLQAGETQRFVFEIDPWRDLSYVNGDGERFLETGVYFILVKDKKITLEIIE
jgi:beta-glucosidase